MAVHGDSDLPFSEEEEGSSYPPEQSFPELSTCRVCLLPLETLSEQLIGTHIWCVYNTESNYVNVAVKRPGYGRRRN